MKIIQLIQKPQLRGAEIFACQLSTHLINSGNEVLVVTIFKGDADLPFNGELLNLNRPLTRRFWDFKGWSMFNEIIRDFKPDIIQANAADTLKFASGAKLIGNWKTPVIFRNANKMGDFIDSKPKKLLNSFLLSNMSRVISVSKNCENDLRSTFNFSPENTTTIEIGVERTEVKKVPPKDLVEVFGRGPVITHIGGFVPEKNHAGVLKIFNRVNNRIPETQLLLIGKGTLEQETKNMVARLNLEDNVHFLGYRSDVLEILKHSEVFILPSLIEGLPAVLLEAMYCETPVVAYEVGGIGEIVNQKTGWLVQKGNENVFVNSILEALTNKKEAGLRLNAAKTEIKKKFLNDIIAKRFEDYYKELLDDNI